MIQVVSKQLNRFAMKLRLQIQKHCFPFLHRVVKYTNIQKYCLCTLKGSSMTIEFVGLWKIIAPWMCCFIYLQRYVSPLDYTINPLILFCYDRMKLYQAVRIKEYSQWNIFQRSTSLTVKPALSFFRNMSIRSMLWSTTRVAVLVVTTLLSSDPLQKTSGTVLMTVMSQW